MRAISRVSTPVVQADVGRPRVQQHHDLLERGVARALAEAVDRDLDLARAGLQARERVRDRETEVVVAMDGQDHVAQAGRQLVEPRQEGGELRRHRVADRVGDVDRRGALVDRRLQHVGGELDVRACRVHRRELDVLAQRARMGDRRSRLRMHVLARGLELVDDVDVRGRDERVDARALGVTHGLPCALDVGCLRPCQAGDDRAVDLACDRLHRLEVTGRGDREPSLDHVDAESRELVGDLELLRRVERDAR